MNAFSSPQIFRYELKFLIDTAVRDHLLELTRGALEPDPHGPGGIYRVTSQYYDSPGLKAYWQKLDGEDPRSKYRLRFYGDTPASPFFEIKHRFNRTIMKERIPLNPESAEVFLREGLGLSEIEPVVSVRRPADAELTGRLVKAGLFESLGPVVTITYMRQALVGAYDPDLRLTFDMHCQALRPEEYLSAPEDRGSPLEPGHPTVMEVKFNERIPRWMRDAVNMVKVRPVRFSKYAKGVEALQEAREWQQQSLR